MLTASLSRGTMGEEMDPVFYRNLVLKIRPQAIFQVPMPNGYFNFSYHFSFSKPLWENPIVNEFSSYEDRTKFYRYFWDKIFVNDYSYLDIHGEHLPVTCISVEGQDNRLIKDSPLFPDYILKIYVVVNDFACMGPINPGWPENGGKKETWETYVYYEVHDPTIMLPIKTKLHYRGLEFPAIVMDEGEKSR